MNCLLTTASNPFEVTLQLCDHGFGSGPILLNRFLMIVVISKRGMNVSQRQMGMRAHNFFRRHSSVNNFSCDLTHLDVRPDDHGPRQRIVDVTLGAGDIASKHAGFLALNRGFGHEIGAGRSGVPDGEHAKSLLRLGRQ